MTKPDYMRDLERSAPVRLAQYERVNMNFPKYAGKELHYIQRMMEGFDFDDWPRAFERKFSEKVGGKYCIAVNSGTSALHAALVACDVKGAEVLVPALTPAMVIFAVIHAGATPVFCDVDPNTHHISWESINDKSFPNVRAILAVSLHGLPFDWSLIKDVAKTFKWFTIDDCAQALGAKGIGKADITCFSFEDKKHLTTGSEGGMIMTENEELATKARKFAGLGYKHMTADAGRIALAAETYQDPDYERFDTIGLNYRMSKVQAAIGLGQLEYLEHIVARRRTVARILANVLNTDNKLNELPYVNHSFYTLPYYWPYDWKKFYKNFKVNGGDGFYAEPLPPYKEPALKPLFPDVHCPIAEDLQKRLMLFKTNYRDLGEAERQAEILRKTLGN